MKNNTTIKGWAITSKNEIPVVGPTYNYCIHETESMAYEQIRNMIFVIGKGYEPKVVPVEIRIKG